MALAKGREVRMANLKKRKEVEAKQAMKEQMRKEILEDLEIQKVMKSKAKAKAKRDAKKLLKPDAERVQLPTAPPPTMENLTPQYSHLQLKYAKMQQ